MTITGVAGFFSQKKRTLRPVGLDLSVLYDRSGSTDDINTFIRTDSFIRNVELSLAAVDIGTKANQPNRYSQGDHEQEFTLNGSRWATGQELLTNTIWSDPQINGPALGAVAEDVTGSAHAIAVGNREYRSGIQRVLLSSSDEQSGTLTQTGTVEGVLTSAGTGQIFVALSGIRLAVNPNPEGDANFQPFGIVFTTPTEGVLITRNQDLVNYYNIPISSVTYESQEWNGGSSYTPNGRFFTLTGPIEVATPGNSQSVNTPRLAAATGGALYDITQFPDSGALQAFANSLGQVLGTFLYQLLS